MERMTRLTAEEWGWASTWVLEDEVSLVSDLVFLVSDLVSLVLGLVFLVSDLVPLVSVVSQ